MAINKKADSKQSKMTEKASAKVQTGESKSKGRSQAKPAKMSDAERRDELVSTGFHPTAVKFLKDELGIDLGALPLNTVYDIKSGRVTEPLDVKVSPLVYDKEKKEVVKMPPIKSKASMRFVFPYDNDFKPVALDKEHRVFVASYPCHQFVQKADPSAQFMEDPGQQAKTAERKELPKFTSAQIMALEGIGINENRLYASSFNALDVETKRNILEGEVFEVNGYVRTSFGVLNVNGEGRLVQMKDGSVRAAFEAQEPVKQGKNDILDINSARRSGNLELDFFERDSSGKVKTDVYDFPVLNQAGKDLVTYGVSFEAVDGYLHKTVYDSKEKRFKDEVEKDRYQVSVVNGGICATRMKKVFDLDQDGNKVKTTFNGKEVDKYHYEVADVRVNSDGTVRVGQDNLKFKTEADLANFKKGIGGTVVGAKWQEYGEKGTKPKEITYDAYVVPDNQKNGFAKVFSPSTSQKLQERNAPKQKTRKKQNFSMGF